MSDEIMLTIYEKIKTTGLLPILKQYPYPINKSNLNQFIDTVLENNNILMASQKYLMEQAEKMKDCIRIYDENKRLRENNKEFVGICEAALNKAEFLEKEVDWLVDELIMSESKRCPLCDCPQKAPDSPTESESIAFLNGCRKCWREAVQMAVEQQNERK